MRGNAFGSLVIFAIIACTGCWLHEEENPNQSGKRLELCKDFLTKHQLEAADTECTKSIKYWSRNDEAFLNRGLVSMIRAVDTQRTLEIENCLTGVDAEATHKDLEMFLTKADKDFERAVEITPDYGEALADRGVVHNLLEDYSAAAEYLTKALDYPQRLMDAGLTRANLGWALFHEEKYVDAAKELREALQFKPKMCVATYRLARVYFARQEWEKAAELFQTASDDPSCGSQEASYYLMKTRMQQGLASEAKEARDACVGRKGAAQSCLTAQCRADGASLGTP